MGRYGISRQRLAAFSPQEREGFVDLYSPHSVCCVALHLFVRRAFYITPVIGLLNRGRNEITDIPLSHLRPRYSGFRRARINTEGSRGVDVCGRWRPQSLGAGARHCGPARRLRQECDRSIMNRIAELLACDAELVANILRRIFPPVPNDASHAGAHSSRSDQSLKAIGAFLNSPNGIHSVYGASRHRPQQTAGAYLLQFKVRHYRAPTAGGSR
jgi:hypothetical protein